MRSKLVQLLVGWARTKVRDLWAAVKPHVDASALTGAALDAVRTRRDLVLENAMLRHQILILRRKVPGCDSEVPTPSPGQLIHAIG
jgi:hypothetical protein